MLGINKPADEHGAAWPSILVGLFAAFAGILYGYDTGTISGILEMDFWQQEFGKDGRDYILDSEQSLIVSILSVGTFVGALSAGILSDITGRKWGIIVSAMIPFNLGVALQTAATEQTICYQLAITIGLLIAACVNYATQNRDDSGSYRIPIAIQFAWALILSFGMFCLPETPRFLVKAGKDSKALKSLMTLRRLPADDPQLIAELEEIKGNWEYEKSVGSAGYIECFRGTTGKRLITGIILQSLQQLVGINFIIYYGTTYFSTNVQKLPSAFILQIITNVINTVTTFPGLYCIDRFGRRPLLLTGALGMGVCQYLVAAIGDAKPNTPFDSAAAQFAFICIYISFFASTFGPGAWVVTGEMFPLKIRAKGLSMTTAANWFFNWLLSFITPYLLGALDPIQSNVFWIWGSFCWIAFVFVFFLIYETKDLSLEQVNELYENESKAWRSTKYRTAIRRFSSVDDGSASASAHDDEKKGRSQSIENVA
ncbi:putative transporter [Hortaea werneckii]|nr:putative transporter [Hortaea werneckii]KAI7576675.1 putative transporter [Hortaea werneckii]